MIIQKSATTQLPLLEQAEQNAIRAEQAAARAEAATGDIVGLDLQSVIFFGDSYTEGYLLDNPDVEVWCARLANLLNIQKWQRFGGGGCGFAHVSASRNVNFLGYWQSIVANINTDATTIFIMGGWNDKDQSESDITTGFNNLIAEIRNTFPSSQTKIVYLFNPSLGLPLSKTITTCYRAARNNNCVVIGDSWYWQYGEVEDFNTDFVHPNNSGQRRVAQYVFSKLCGGEIFHRRLINLNDKDFADVTCNLIVENDTAFLFVNARKDNTQQTSTIGHFSNSGDSSSTINLRWMRVGWEGREGPSFNIRELQSFDDDTGLNIGYVSFGGGSNSIYLRSMRKLDDSTVWASGRLILARDYQLLDLCG